MSTRGGHGSGWTEQRFDAALANLLRAGVLISATIVLGGAFVFLRRHGGDAPDYRIFRGAPVPLRSIGGIVREALGLSGDGLIQLGLLVLIATPVARVVVSIIGFARRRDWLYVTVTLVVVAFLVYSLTRG